MARPSDALETRPQQISPDWLMLLACPIIWAGYFLVGYTAAEFGCQGGWLQGRIAGLPALPAVIVGLTLLALALSGWTTWRTWQRWLRLRPHPDARLSRVDERHRFMVLVGLLLGGLFTFTIVLTGVPAILLPAC
jgi:hypothetical protein